MIRAANHAWATKISDLLKREPLEAISSPTGSVVTAGEIEGVPFDES